MVLGLLLVMGVVMVLSVRDDTLTTELPGRLLEAREGPARFRLSPWRELP